ncbi:MAG TPA: TadE/TadG family type IV pilus assembly protein [Acidimicrobiales bacterium]|jgi:Flp pilus assembly protein TadG|nr:TadE/TadG family type IV pilus assembly protein [Acidimicrobiales bacterium]
MTPGRRERGSAVLEAVIGAPFVILLLVTLIGAGRVANAHQIVTDAAGDAARAASEARSSPTAQVAAQRMADISMSGRGVSCAPMAVAVDTTAWHPGGSVGVTLSCTVQLADLGIPILGNTRTVTARAAAVVDIYRQQGP